MEQAGVSENNENNVQENNGQGGSGSGDDSGVVSSQKA
jgi:hypothetical protein